MILGSINECVKSVSKKIFRGLELSIKSKDNNTYWWAEQFVNMRSIHCRQYYWNRPGPPEKSVTSVMVSLSRFRWYCPEIITAASLRYASCRKGLFLLYEFRLVGFEFPQSKLHAHMRFRLFMVLSHSSFVSKIFRVSSALPIILFLSVRRNNWQYRVWSATLIA